MSSCIQLHLKFAKWVLFSSVGGAGIPCTEALYSLQWTQVRLQAWVPLLHVTPPLSHLVSYQIFI